tara:strand:- start:30 stop:569 length:540 start_codon:yes stop_codon:yes gene_type:complete
MKSNPNLPETLGTRISDLEAEVRALEYPRTLSNFRQWDQSGVYGIRINGGGWAYSFPAFYIGDTLNGSNVSFTCVVSNAFGATSPWNLFAYFAYEVRYRQEAPQLYTQAEIDAGTNYIVLTSGFVPLYSYVSEYSTTILAPITDTLQGTYGVVEFWFDSLGPAVSERIYVTPSKMGLAL